MHMHDSLINVTLKSAFREWLRQTLTDPNYILQAFVGRTHISHVTILPLWAKGGAKWWRKGGCFVTVTMNSLFFLTGHIGMKFGKKRLAGVLYLTLIEEFWKFSLKWVILHPNRHFAVDLTGLLVTDVTFFDYAKLSLPSNKGRVSCIHTRLFVRLNVSAVEAPKVTQILLS